MARRKAVTPDERGFLDAIEKNPDDTTARVAYADWLDEHDRPYDAVLQRERAGVAEVRYKVRRKSDGLFACGRSSNNWPDLPKFWSHQGKMWRKLSQLQQHIRRDRGRSRKYGGTPWSDVEIAVVELRPVVVATLPAANQKLIRKKRGAEIDTA
jgi:uncharacterized protein (TIGR02996 family)